MFFVPEIVPWDFSFPADTRGRVHDVVVRISTSRQGWHGPVDSVRIRRIIDGGRSGALVLDVVLRAGSEHRQRVVKIGPPAEMAEEFANFQRFLRDYPAAVCAPIQEVTDGAGEQGGTPAAETEAVVYAHVEDYAGRPEVPAVTLEDVVRAAFHDEDAEPVFAQTLITTLFAAMATPFHNRRAGLVAERSLRDLNPTLGPDLVVEAGAVPAEVRLSYPEDVLQVSLGDETFAPGTPIRLADPTHSTVSIKPDASAGRATSGIVVNTRFAARRAAFDEAFETVDRTTETVEADGVRTAEPARGLRRVLTDPGLGRVRGVVHGDLNARNVMCVDGRPVLIDFARTTDDHPVFADAAWLEISLVRDVFAELPYGDLVRVQRLLALVARLRVPEADDRLASLLEGRAEIAFRILAKIRSSAARSYPREVIAWQDYLAQVHFAAYRTAKWEGEVQTAAKLRAVHAAAAVATEWLADAEPFAHWGHLAEVLECVASFADPADPEAVDVIAGLVAAVDRVGLAAGSVNLRELSDRYVTRHFSAEARELVMDLSREHDEFLSVVPKEEAKPLVLVGGVGCGKTQILRELAYRSAMDVVRPEAGTAARRMPRLVDARRLLAEGTDRVGLPQEALVLGAVRLLVDGVDDVPPADRKRLFDFVSALHGRFPRTPVVLVSRSRDQADRTGLQVVLVDTWEPGVALRFLAEKVGAARHFESLSRELHALGGATPGLLKMYLDVARGRRDAVPLTEVYHEYFVTRLGELDPAGLVEAAETSVDTGGPVAPPDGIDGFVARGVLRRDGGQVVFVQGAERDFFAALSLAPASEDVLRARARSFAWRPVVLLAARLSEVPDVVLETVVDAVADGDPRFAARLLRLRPTLPGHDEFVRSQSAFLGDPKQGNFVVLSAVEALKAVGTPDALDQLERRLTDPATSPEVLRAALSALTRLLPKSEDFSLPDGWLRDLLGQLLDVTHSREARLEAIRIVKDRKVRGLDLMLAGLVTEADPLVAQAADDALSSLEVVLPAALRAGRPALIAARLVEIERVLPTLTTNAETQGARTERLRQLKRLDDRAYWLPRLYAYGIRHDVADQLDGTLADPVDLSAVQHLGDLDAGAANALAHRILAEHPQLRDDLVFAADVRSPTFVLLIAAAAVRSPATVEHAVQLVGQLAEEDAGARIEGLAALAHALVQADPAVGFRVSRDAARRLRERAISARLHWPWTTMLAHTRPGPGELDALLAQGEARAISEVAMACTALDGAPDQPVEPGGAARRFLLTDRTGEPVVRALALCAAGLTDGLPQIVEMLSDRSLGADAMTVSSGQYGPLELAPLAEILAAYGQLARGSGEARQIVADVDPRGLHASVADGKAVALGYLGDWVPVVEAALGDGGRLDTAARHTLGNWVPGPATPSHLREPGAIASWLKERLADVTLDAGRRSLTQELLLDMERRHGALCPD